MQEHNSKWALRRQRVFDVCLVAAAAPVWVPALGLVGFLVRVLDGSPVLFRQRRVGLGGAEFDILKFRTMPAVAKERFGPPAAADVTRLGRFLRSSSLDEVPQFINVFRGDMSLVGPRPVRPQHLRRSARFSGARLSVRPGVTGLAQVSGRNELTWDEKIDLDLEYVRKRSLLLDLRILFQTADRVLRKSAIDHVVSDDPLGTNAQGGAGGSSA